MDTQHQIAYIGLGRMGEAMTAKLVSEGVTVHGFDINEKARENAQSRGVITHESIVETIEALSAPRTVFIMVPSAHTGELIEILQNILEEGDTIIDGGNSFFKDSMQREVDLSAVGIEFLDCGTSGGVRGALTGASLMVGGDHETFLRHEWLFRTLATHNGYAHVGGPGAGHFCKMVHNAIEYGMMGAIAEGINVLQEHKDALDINIHEALKPYEHGSIIQGTLMSWISDAFRTPGFIEHIAGEVPKGETEMEMEYLTQHEDMLVLTSALAQRKKTRQTPSFIGTLIAAMRHKFGGHAVITTNKTKER